MLTIDYDRMGARPGEVLLDLGCGAGRHTFEALRRGMKVVAVDLDAPSLRDVRDLTAALAEAGDTPPSAACLQLQADALRLPFADAAFDRVIVSEVLEHIPDDEVAMAEIARVLKPGGSAAVSVPRTWPERVCWALSDAYHQNDGGHVRIYRDRELGNKLAAAGLNVFERHHAHALHAPYWWIRCAFGVRNEDALIPKLYHRFLVWDLVKRPRVTRAVERTLDPILGKSLVVYLRKTPTRAYAS